MLNINCYTYQHSHSVNSLTHDGSMTNIYTLRSVFSISRSTEGSMRYSHQTWRENGIGIPLELSFKLYGCEKNCIQILNAKCQHRTCSLSFTIGTSRINKDVRSNKRSAVYLQNKQTQIKMQLLTTVKKNLYYRQTYRQVQCIFRTILTFQK